MSAVIEHRRFRQIPEIVLDKPEQRVRNRVVVEVVGESRWIDPAHLETGGVRRFDHHRLAAAPEVELTFEPIPRRCHPYRARGLGKAGEARHESARSPNEAFPIPRVGRQVNGRAIGRHDRMEVLEEAPGVLFDRQHRLT